MGTNYYAKRLVSCHECGHDSVETTHLGKSSVGWCFSLHVYPDRGINTWADVQTDLTMPLTFIVDEYGRGVSLSEFRGVVTCREHPGNGNHLDAQFLQRNHAVLGPNGLLAHKIDGARVLGHGEGTYDYCVGEFS